MSEIYEWAKQIFLFGIFEKIILSILPKNKFENIIGIVLKVILMIIVLKPILVLTGTDELMYESIVRISQIYNEAGENADTKLKNMENYEEKIYSMTEQDISNNIKTIVEKHGLGFYECKVSFNGNNYSKLISKISVWIMLNPQKSGEKQNSINIGRIDKVNIKSTDSDIENENLKKHNYGEEIYSLKEEILKEYMLEDSQLELIVKE